MENFCEESYCGIYCGACDVQITYKRAQESGTVAEWEDLPERFRKHLPTGKTDEIKCFGCKTDTVFAGCARCQIRKCARNKMKVDSCFECRKFPCLKFKIQIFFMKRMEKKLPHIKTIQANQEQIKSKGVDTWLQEQHKMWQCPECSTAFSWYQTVCETCGLELESRKDFLESAS